jgi:hypothetical protein
MSARVFMFVCACVRRMVKIINIKINIAFIAPFQEKIQTMQICTKTQRELAAYVMCVQYYYSFVSTLRTYTLLNYLSEHHNHVFTLAHAH